MVLGSSVVEPRTVNALVGGPNPSRGAKVNAPIAQLVERQFCKLDVVGSNPAGGTTCLNRSTDRTLDF